jgi:hypothetical protein
MSRRGCNKSAPVKAAVIAKHLAGKNNAEIAREVGISRPTIIKILSEAEMGQMATEAKSNLFGAIPDAVRCYSEAVGMDAERAESFLERMKILPGKEPSGGVAINNFIGLGTLSRTDSVQHRGPVLAQPETD